MPTLCFALSDTIVCWEGLLSWSERRVITNQFQGDVQQLKEVLEQLGSKTFNICSESHIQLAIDQLKVCETFGRTLFGIDYDTIRP